MKRIFLSFGLFLGLLTVTHYSKSEISRAEGFKRCHRLCNNFNKSWWHTIRDRKRCKKACVGVLKTLLKVKKETFQIPQGAIFGQCHNQCVEVNSWWWHTSSDIKRCEKACSMALKPLGDKEIVPAAGQTTIKKSTTKSKIINRF